MGKKGREPALAHVAHPARGWLDPGAGRREDDL